jgi:acyl dehydratase
MIGRTFDSYSLDVEKGDLVRYAESAHMTSPLYTDEARARRARYGGLVAAPTYLIVMRILEARVISAFHALIPYETSLDGGSEWSYFEPIRPGDRIDASASLVNLYEREGKLGHMLFATVDIEYTNQFGRVVVKQRDTGIWY